MEGLHREGSRGEGRVVICQPSWSDEYNARDPTRSPLFRIIEDWGEDFRTLYEELFERTHGRWRGEVDRTLDALLECGDPRSGFARIRCASCSQGLSRDKRVILHPIPTPSSASPRSGNPGRSRATPPVALGRRDQI